MKECIITKQGIIYREVIINACNYGAYVFEFGSTTYEDSCIYKCTEIIDELIKGKSEKVTCTQCFYNLYNNHIKCSGCNNFSNMRGFKK